MDGVYWLTVVKVQCAHRGRLFDMVFAVAGGLSVEVRG